MGLNPVAPVLDTARAWFLGTPPDYLAGFVVTGVGAGVLLLAAWIAYRLALPILLERMSA
jgi:lipopolysaccharide transport system permease protein